MPTIDYLTSFSTLKMVPTVNIMTYNAGDPTHPTKTSVEIDPEKLYDVTYYNENTGEIKTFTGKPRSIVFRGDLIKACYVNMEEDPLTGVCEQIIFDYSEKYDAHPIVCEITGIRSIAVHS